MNIMVPTVYLRKIIKFHQVCYGCYMPSTMTNHIHKDKCAKTGTSILNPVYEIEKRFIGKYRKDHGLEFMQEFIAFANELANYVKEEGANNEK